MNPIEKALERSRAVSTSARDRALRMKQAGVLDMAPSGSMQLEGLRDQQASRERYGLYRGWLYAAINALAMEASGQPVNVARLEGVKPKGEERGTPSAIKQWTRRKMTSTAENKTAREEFEVVNDHVLLDMLDQPNEIQSRGQFVYTFVANLNLTGWAFVIGGEEPDGKLRFYSLPTTWVHPDHKDGPFSKFKIVNPQNQSGEGTILTRKNVAFACMPDPRNPLAALAPAETQIAGIRIDDHIQASQELFFENGVFPSVVITIGKQPFGSDTATRPTLTGPQRRQVMGAVQKQWMGVANYGSPAIVDGLVESITRLSATQNEMGWEKSEQSIKARILSAFSVHPFILGEPVNVGGYAQATSIRGVFFDRVNVFLDMLSNLMSNFAAPHAAALTESNERLLVWWEKKEAVDRNIRSQNYREGRKNGDITRNEFRASVGLAPDETAEENRSKLLENPAALSAVMQVFNGILQGSVTREGAAKLLVTFFEIPEEVADAIVGVGEISVPAAIDELQAAVQVLKKPLQIEMTSTAMDKLLQQEISKCCRGHE